VQAFAQALVRAPAGGSVGPDERRRAGARHGRDDVDRRRDLAVSNPPPVERVREARLRVPDAVALVPSGYFEWTELLSQRLTTLA
jgi:hypothetical protein